MGLVCLRVVHCVFVCDLFFVCVLSCVCALSCVPFFRVPYIFAVFAVLVNECWECPLLWERCGGACSVCSVSFGSMCFTSNVGSEM